MDVNLQIFYGLAFGKSNMNSMNFKTPIKFLAFGILFAFGLGLLISTASKKSLVYDEVIYAPAGLMTLRTGDFGWNPEHPPLQKFISALPLLWDGTTVPMELKSSKIDAWRAGYIVFFQDPTRALKRIFLCRLPTILMTFGLILVFMMALRTFRWDAIALGVLVLFSDPLMVANGSLAMNDMFVTFFLFTGVTAFYFGLKNMNTKETYLNSWFLWTIAGASAGCAVASKYSGFLILPLLFLFILIRFPSLNKQAKVNAVVGFLLVGLISTLVILACYKFQIHIFLASIKEGLLLRSKVDQVGYLLGPIAGTSTWFYYPVAFLVKTPLPLLALYVLSSWILFSKRKKGEFPIYFPLLPVLLFFGAAMISKNHFGIRYLLPAVPFLALAVAQAYSLSRDSKEIVIFWVLVLGLSLQTLIQHPHHMAFFNEIAGGSKNGYKWLDGSNQDWGQDLPALQKFLSSQNPAPAVFMGYWGSNQPEAWGITYQDVLSPAITNSFRKEFIHPVDCVREYLVVSASLLHHPLIRDTYAWLENRTPVTLLGYTLFVYDITHDLDSVLHLRDIYKSMERWDAYERQVKRGLFLEPDNKMLLEELRDFKKIQNSMRSPDLGKKKVPEKI
jgi:4-amino-4-deoxy-L-arabinose transferase-like glycosyltransferase